MKNNNDDDINERVLCACNFQVRDISLIRGAIWRVVVQRKATLQLKTYKLAPSSVRTTTGFLFFIHLEKNQTHNSYHLYQCYDLNAATLAIHGDTDVERGNISLSLRERDSPITIARGTKNLILEKALDREGKTGPSSVYVNVICDRRHSSDPVSMLQAFM